MSHKKWSIEKVDYQRDSGSTNAYEKKIKRKNILVTIGKIIGALFIIAILALLITI